MKLLMKVQSKTNEKKKSSRKGMWTCMNRFCQLQKPMENYSKARAKHSDNVNGNSRVCDDCFQKNPR